MACKRIASSPMAVRLIHRDQNQIRQRLLQRLGISASSSMRQGTGTSTSGDAATNTARNSTVPYGQTTSCCFPGGSATQQKKNNNRSSREASSSSIITISSSSSLPSTCSPSSCREPLEYDDNASSLSSSWLPARRSVKWSTHVSVHEIPSRHDYDDETREQLWTSLKDLASNAHRNRMEYRADGCDYQRATEESAMLPWLDSSNGKMELVHPATYWLLYEQEQERVFLLEEKANIVNNNNDNPRSLRVGCGFARMSTGMKRSQTRSSFAELAV